MLTSRTCPLLNGRCWWKHMLFPRDLLPATFQQTAVLSLPWRPFSMVGGWSGQSLILVKQGKVVTGAS